MLIRECPRISITTRAGTPWVSSTLAVVRLRSCTRIRRRPAPVFALDSIPAIFGLTHDAYIVITANAFALMGLRQLYFLRGELLRRLAYLNIGLGVILGFIGVKLLIEALQGSHVHSVGPVPLPHIGIVASMIFIVVALAVTVMASAAKERAEGRACPRNQLPGHRAVKPTTGA